MEITIARSGLENWEAKILPKGILALNRKSGGHLVPDLSSTITRENHFGLCMVDFLARVSTESIENPIDSVSTTSSGFREED